MRETTDSEPGTRPAAFLIDRDQVAGPARRFDGGRPVQVAVGPDGGFVYVSLNGDDEVAKVDLRSRRVVGRVGRRGGHHHHGSG